MHVDIKVIHRRENEFIGYGSPRWSQTRWNLTRPGTIDLAQDNVALKGIVQ
jgi:hypothetical protein